MAAEWPDGSTPRGTPPGAHDVPHNRAASSESTSRLGYWGLEHREALTHMWHGTVRHIRSMVMSGMYICTYSVLHLAILRAIRIPYPQSRIPNPKIKTMNCPKQECPLRRRAECYEREQGAATRKAGLRLAARFLLPFGTGLHWLWRVDFLARRLLFETASTVLSLLGRDQNKPDYLHLGHFTSSHAVRLFVRRMLALLCFSRALQEKAVIQASVLAPVIILSPAFARTKPHAALPILQFIMFATLTFLASNRP